MSSTTKEATAYLGLGSNLGDRLSSMRAAVHSLNSHPLIFVDLDSGIASLYETSPVGVSAEQGFFLNSAIRVRTALPPHDLLEVMLSVEKSLGRVRGATSGARTVDIDLLLYDDLVISDERLSLPHPRLHQRRFVLEPLSEIAAGLIHPLMKLSIADLARRRRDERNSGELVTLTAAPDWHKNLHAEKDTRPAASARIRLY